MRWVCVADEIVEASTILLANCTICRIFSSIIWRFCARNCDLAGRIPKDQAGGQRDRLMNRPTLQQQVTFLHTAVLGETAVFYQTILGLPLALDQGVCQIFQVTPTAFFGFCRHLEGARPSGVILTLVAEDVDDWHAYLKAQGVAIEKPPTLNETFNIYHCFIRDPNGYLIEIQRFLDPTWPGV